ncbi:ankyrin repeat domain-containing protein [Dyella acidiphila]|uniref:Ankyrin repeat domain-containing protein n=1 Tax=Dyella acidiphila TaxID=2775866 RepID=A0ABR9GCI5_9GAMM|nr:ankyrin repeat domain-containing protein [Dyella acidiphila]MBE1161771.1 ankyrin repeat domain-containing protein [Dyella acidiphila]
MFTSMRRFGLLAILSAIYLLSQGCGSVQLAGKSASEVFHDPQVVSLIRAAGDHDEKKAKSLLVAGVDINASGEAGITPLIWMIAKHDNEAIHLLLELGADPNKPWQQGEAPVYMAASAGNVPLLNMLLDYHGDPNSPAHQRSAMMIAMLQLHFDCAALLVKRGADINYHDGVVSSISAPLAVGHFDWVVWMLRNGYTHDLQQALRGVTNTVPTDAQAGWREQALQIINQRLVAQSAGG